MALSEKDWVDFSTGEDPDVSEDRHLFDSRIETGSIGPAPNKFWTTLAQRREYYTAKFGYFVDVLEAKLEDPEATPPSGPPSVPARVVARWDEEFPMETKAYVLRILQSPPELVHKTWYNATLEFQTWAAGVLKALREEPHGPFATWLQFPVCLDEEFEIHDWLNAGVQQVASLPGNAQLSLSVSLSRQPRPAGAIARSFALLEQIFSEGHSSYADAISKILLAMQTEFDVAICDYLQVTNAGSPSAPGLLDFQATTTDHKIETLQEGEPAYDFAGGITGSAFLAENDDLGRVLLTSVLDLDPRQSKEHAETYANAYGPIYNFCIVPVFDGSQLIGVFRFINRSGVDPEACCVGKRGTWPLDYRIELTSLATWLSGPMRALRLTLEGTPDSALSEVMRNPGWLSWAPLKARSALLRDLAQVATMRDEHRTVSATVFAAAARRCDEFESANVRYTDIPEGHLTEATQWFGRLLPGGGVFVSDISTMPLDGRIRYRSVVNTGHLSFADAVVEVTRIAESSLLYADGAVGVVHCYEHQEWSADYFLDEKVGRWQMRSRATLEHQLAEWPKKCGMEPLKFMDLVFTRIIPHSYTGHGGLIVLSNDNPRDDTVRFGFEVNSTFDMDAALFERVVAVDGGTWIRPNGTVEQGGIIFRSEVTRGQDRGGARHQVAQGLVRNDPDRVVISISANRPITFWAVNDELRI